MKHDNTVMTIASVKVMSGGLRLWYTLTTCMFYCLFLPKHNNTVLTKASVKFMSGCLGLWYTLTTCMFYCLFLPKHDNTVMTIACQGPVWRSQTLVYSHHMYVLLSVLT